MKLTPFEAVIVGAGPYGLSAAAHLRAAGMETRVFGEAMGFWRRQMPRGMLLISDHTASQIADPRRAFTFNAYETAHQLQLAWPLPIRHFIEYGQWFQRQTVPDLDPRRITQLEPAACGFRLVLEDGEYLHTRHVIVATGLGPFARRPAPFTTVPSTLASHTSDHDDLGQLAGRQVAVIGSGQSAVTSAALLHEAGAEVEMVIRSPQIHWVRRTLHRRLGPFRRLVYAPTDVGPAGLSWIVGLPGLFRYLPVELRERLTARATRPAGAPWLRPRVAGVTITVGRTVTAAVPVGERLHLTLDDGSVRRVDHALLATGYRVDITRYTFLASALLQSLHTINGSPELGAGFESSVPGLHFIGAPAAASFGPVTRFVSGTSYTARALVRHLGGEAQVPEPVLREFPTR